MHVKVSGVWSKIVAASIWDVSVSVIADIDLLHLLFTLVNTKPCGKQRATHVWSCTGTCVEEDVTARMASYSARVRHDQSISKCMLSASTAASGIRISMLIGRKNEGRETQLLTAQ